MLNKTHTKLMYEAIRENKAIVPVRGRIQFDESSFTQHTDAHGISWIFFWYNDMQNDTHITKMQISCPQCGNELTFANIDCGGHCVLCEQRGQ